jgi:uncharacterized protein YyaL (SSP411 family)
MRDNSLQSDETSNRGHGRRANALAGEKSPYLLQHQHNPVDWQPWGAPAFDQAKRENKPIFLSIGYSTCHWCHVMERESFEDPALAEVLNAHFVSIKVDREERPDIDKIYMTFVTATLGQGGWPLNVFLTPDLKPFYGGTYFPPDNRYGRPSFRQVLDQIRQVWTARQPEILQSAESVQEKLHHVLSVAQSDTSGFSTDTLRHAAEALKGSYDAEHGGFGGAPKFPQPSHPQFLLRWARRAQDAEALQMVLHTCERMAAGGIYDQLGGGFARYSVDAEWLVPHFEKMLYDNAQLAQMYLDAHLAAGLRGNAPHFANVVRGILDYVLRDMTHPEGGFFSAEDADSEGHEGKFYCWTHEELSRLLSPEEFQLAARYYGVTPQGNFVDHSHPSPLPGQNVLSIQVREDSLSADAKALLDSAKRKLLEARSRRVRPHLDDKVLTSWNGLMLGAFARAFAVLGEPAYREAAEKNLRFVREHLWSEPDRTLYHRWREGERDQAQLSEDYAFLLAGVVDLYEATLDPEHLEFALKLGAALLERFYDVKAGGFWQSGAGAGDLILRLKEDHDGAIPSAGSVASLALLKLGHIAGCEDFIQAGEKSVLLYADRIEQAPQAVPGLLAAVDFLLQPPARVVISGDVSSPAAQALLKAAHAVYQPNRVLLGTAGPVEPFAKTLPKEVAAYLCSGTACQPLVKAPELLKQALAG